MFTAEIITDIIFTVLSIATAWYAYAVWRWMRERHRLARRKVGSGSALARGAARVAFRKLCLSLIFILIGTLISVRDVLEHLENPESFNMPSFVLRLLFIAAILLIFDSTRIQKVTYVRSERR